MLTSILRPLAARAERLADWVTVRNPALGLRLAAGLGDLAARFADTARTASAEDVDELFGPMDAARARSIRRDIARVYFWNHALRRVIAERGLDPLLPLIDVVSAEPLLRLRREGAPVVVVGWHHGPVRAPSLALRKLGIPALFALGGATREPDGDADLVRYARLHGEATDDIRFLKRAHRALLDGAVVGAHIDWSRAGETLAFLGRKVRVGRGPAALARIAGARLVPVSRRFAGSSGRIEVTFHDPIADSDLAPETGPQFEDALLERTLRRLEADVRADPGSQRPEGVARLVAAPPADGAPEAARARHAERTEQRRARQREQWETKWGSDAFDRPWRGRDISPEIREAVASGWFPRGGRALDAGCGEGEVAAWLAEQGHPAVGIDVAEAAVARARAAHGDRSGALRFARADLCAAPPVGGPFRVVVDRGCFLQIPDEDRRAYATNLAAACAADARLLLFGRAFRDGVAMGDPREIERKRAEVMEPFAPHFELERVAATYLDRHRGDLPEERLPGIVFWLRRRGE